MNGYKLYGRGETPDGYEFTDDTIGRMCGWQEECPCDTCGVPLFEGERAILVEDGTAYCSRNCMKKGHPGHDPLDDPDYSALNYYDR